MQLTRHDHGVTWHLDEPVSRWLQAMPIQYASRLNQLVELDGTPTGDWSVTVTNLDLAQWPEEMASYLGLPKNIPLGFDIRLEGAMGKSGAKLNVKWLVPGKTIAARNVEVAKGWAHWEGKDFRLPSPIFETLESIHSFNALDDASLQDQFRIWADIRKLLGDELSDNLTDGFLKSFRVFSASALTFSLETDQFGDVQIVPVLLTPTNVNDGEPNEYARALTGVDEDVLVQRLDQLPIGSAAFPLGRGTYLVAEGGLREALSAVKKIRKATPDIRKRAALNPEAVIRELLEQSDSDPTVFVETEKYAERVRDIAVWSTPILPWIKVVGQDWTAPSSYGVKLDGVEIPLTKEALDLACTSVASAIDNGDRLAKVAGREIPATMPNLTVLRSLAKAIDESAFVGPQDREQDTFVKKVLVIETNFDDASFLGKSATRQGVAELPQGLRTPPKPHQETGLRWLQEHWLSGSKGALLCDDMGLGKTFQALAFCVWLQEQMSRGSIRRGPILLIAPVGLLRNWEAEIDEHLFAPGLGSIVRAYGDHLKLLKRGRHADGTAGLDTMLLATASVVLANYEAVSDYQLSFGAVKFTAVVMDEAQKVKSPKARMTHAIKALNAEFLIAMTGTPIENRLADLWCIADTVQPGVLSNLRDFSLRYESSTEHIHALRSSIWQDEDAVFEKPKLLMRRLKSEKLEGLPAKFEHPIRVSMPQRQAEAYGRALAIKEVSGPQGTLGMIHALRRISLHPSLLEQSTCGSAELRIEDSARMMAAFQVLDQIFEKDEKALIFLESLDLQEADQLPLLLKRRYNLAKLPSVINGEISAEGRQKRVDAFQRDPRFDIMLLSPKAGGVGLTLTAANHVIHLSRWWNPAVEDQCSDRVYRIGQTKPVHIYYPLAVLPGAEESSFDVQLQMLMERKRDLARNLLAAPAFTKQDYEALVASTRQA